MPDFCNVYLKSGEKLQIEGTAANLAMQLSGAGDGFTTLRNRSGRNVYVRANEVAAIEEPPGAPGQIRLS